MYYRKIYSTLKLLILTVFALYITTFCSLPALAASPNENCITVNAGASMEVAPDLAYLRCNIVGKGATAVQATADSSVPTEIEAKNITISVNVNTVFKLL